jgi:hypothetical protein
VLQPLQVKAYARLHLRRAKNDRLDAMLIACCAALDEPPREPDPRLPPLVDALTLVEQIEEDIARWKTRLEHIDQSRLRRLVLADLTRMQARRTAELKRIAQAVRRQDDLARRLDLVLSVPGIGQRTALASSCACPNSVTSPESRPPHWPDWHPSTTTPDSIRANGTSPAGAAGRDARCSPRPSPPHSAGTPP